MYLGGLLGTIGTGGIPPIGGKGAVRGCLYGDGVRGAWMLVLDRLCMELPGVGIQGPVMLLSEAVAAVVICGSCGESSLEWWMLRRRRRRIRRINRARARARAEPRPAARPTTREIGAVLVLCVVSMSGGRVVVLEAVAGEAEEEMDDNVTELGFVCMLDESLEMLGVDAIMAVLNVFD